MNDRSYPKVEDGFSRLVEFDFEMGPRTASEDIERFAFSYFLGLDTAGQMDKKSASELYVSLWDKRNQQRRW